MIIYVNFIVCLMMIMMIIIIIINTIIRSCHDFIVLPCYLNVSSPNGIHLFMILLFIHTLLIFCLFHYIFFSPDLIHNLFDILVSAAKSKLTKPGTKHKGATDKKHLTHLAHIFVKFISYVHIARFRIRTITEISKHMQSLSFAQPSAFIFRL